MEGSSIRWESLFSEILSDIIHDGDHVEAGKSNSVGSQRSFFELQNYQFSLADPRDRILAHPVRDFNIVGAIARFVWMCSGSDRTSDIAFYEPRIMGFSDDGISVPGSNYGTRLFQPRAGLNQVLSAVDRLKKDPGTRRAAAIIWQPDDAVRESKDIPCTFGISFSIRRGVLNSTLIMRSNAAYRLVPFNVFEFSLLSELVAVLSGNPVGQFTLFAVSLHIYDSERGKVEQLIANSDIALHSPMPSMPPSTTWEDILWIVRLENKIRNAACGLTNYNWQEYLLEIEEGKPYWADFAKVLLTASLWKNNLIRAASQVIDSIGCETFKFLLLRNPVASDPELQRLEENEVLLESRASFLRASKQFPLSAIGQREDLWRSWTQGRDKDRDVVGAQYRDRARTEDQWRRDFQIRLQQQVEKEMQPTLFEFDE